ncbi:putative inactive serine/threonine-protein kinase bub1-like [Dorcoceras hygrometricum]|uniref:Putative inactive serine/threonine-protein kinase bub1-like n=1 Tax=Dorcoceras hygrometricum TaxID=472368 RepID=A0A2Z7BK23_9LAMI|nr:putative inactive serine/threonine-protein kinase bub1-like [Dorcoceras hygrometricum]
MDFVDDPKGVLRTMEINHIGMKKSLFYLAYALYYEKMKKFDAAEKIYHLGVQNAAEPADELLKSYELFLHRIKRHKDKRIQGRQVNGKSLSSGRVFLTHDRVRPCHENLLKTDAKPGQTWSKEYLPEMQSKIVNIGSKMDQPQISTDEISMKEVRQGRSKKFYSEDTVVGKFVDPAIVGKSNAKNSQHHGLVEPTINTKEAMNEINSMFQKPLEPSISYSRGDRNKSETDNFLNEGFEVFEDEVGPSQQNLSKDSILPRLKRSDANDPLKTFEIYVDSENTLDDQEKIIEKGVCAKKSASVHISSSHANDSSCAYPSDIPPECFKEPSSRRATEDGPREDTVVYRFVGSTISNEPKVENVWHHGLVEPTINLKEAMSDINSMFGKSIEFRRKSRPKKQSKVPEEVQSGQFLILPDDELDNHEAVDNCKLQEPMNQNEVPIHHEQFLVLPDDDLVNMQYNSLPSLSSENISDLFEQTLCTKEAVTEINKLFSMPMDF